jgi:hypothetical protein
LFILAAGTGAFMRFGVFAGMGGLQYANVRHAHSHLMYFGWVTPALMTLIAVRLPAVTGHPAPRAMHRVAWLALGLGLLAYVPFLLYGYRPAIIAGVELPLSVIAAGLNVVPWVSFAWLFRRAVREAPPSVPRYVWSAALLFLLASIVGVIGLPIMTLTGRQDPFWSLAFTHIFLDLFSEGWFVLGMLGMIYAGTPAAAEQLWSLRATDLLALGLPVIWLLYMPTHLVTLPLRLLGGVGGLLATAGLLAHVWVLWPRARVWRLPLFFLVLKALSQLVLIPPAWARWVELARLRVPYLHWLLLGFITLGLVTAAEGVWGRDRIPGRRFLSVAVLLLVLSLVPLSGLWPTAWGGRWVLYTAAWVALGPVVAAAGMWVWRLVRAGRKPAHGL